MNKYTAAYFKTHDIDMKPTTPSVCKNLTYKRSYVCLFVCTYAGDGQPNGWADQDQT